MTSNGPAGTDKVVLVTGGATGIGRATARRFAAAGYRVAIQFHTSEGAAADLLDELNASHSVATAYRADLRSATEIEGLVAAVVGTEAGLDVLVNSAGVLHYADAFGTTRADWEDTLLVNLSAPFLCAQAAANEMKRLGGGSIVSVASVAGLTGGSMGPAYAAAKGGVIALTRALARELPAYGIRVNCVAPTLTDTNLIRRPELADAVARIGASNPFGRLALPEEIAEVVFFLASPAASYINGECVAITGGS
jgi:3-oxoacyl-[acyl-carrier protein] reductase